MRSGAPLFSAATSKQHKSVLAPQAVTALHYDPRRIFLRVCLKPVSLLLISVHGPHRATESQLIEAFWTETLRLIRHLHKSDYIILAGDCNAAVGTVNTDAFGPHFAENEDTAGSALREIAELLQLWCPCTFAERHTGPCHTYQQKKNGKLCRPDLILVPQSWQCGDVKSTTEAGIHAAQVNPDHVAALLIVRLTLGPARISAHAKRPCIPPRLVADPRFGEQVKDVLHTAPAVPWHISAHAHAAVLTDHLQKGLAKLSHAQERRPKHAYIREETWALQRHLSGLRRSVHRRQGLLRRHCLLACIKVWKSSGLSWCHEFSDSPWVQQLRVTIAAQVCHLRHTSQALREACRNDRDTYVAALADKMSTGPSNEVFSAYHKLLVHRRKKPYQVEPLPIILDASGQPCLDTASRFGRWRDHFSALEAGSETSSADISASVLDPLRPDPFGSHPHPMSIEVAPSIYSSFTAYPSSDEDWEGSWT